MRQPVWQDHCLVCMKHLTAAIILTSEKDLTRDWSPDLSPGTFKEYLNTWLKAWDCSASYTETNYCDAELCGAWSPFLVWYYFLPGVHDNAGFT